MDHHSYPVMYFELSTCINEGFLFASPGDICYSATSWLFNLLQCRCSWFSLIRIQLLSSSVFYTIMLISLVFLAPFVYLLKYSSCFPSTFGYPGYDTELHPVVRLQFWSIWACGIIPSFLSLPGLLWPGVLIPVKAPFI